MDWDTIAPILVSGIVLGSLYAMMATGLSLICSTLGIFNFAHGVIMTLGAYVAWQVGTEDGFGLGIAAGLALGVAATIGVGCLIEVTLVRPFLGRANVVLLAVITTLAASVFIENAALLTWSGRIKQQPPLIAGDASILRVTVSAHEALIVGISPAILIALWLFLKVSRTGRAIRAVSQNRDSALLAGMNVPLLYALAFGMSAGLAGFAGILLGSIRFISPVMGGEPMVKAMIVAIFGGLGSLAGTVGAAYLIGARGGERVRDRPVLDTRGLVRGDDRCPGDASHRPVRQKVRPAVRQRLDRATVGKIAGAAALVLLPLVIGDSYLRHLVIVAMIYAVIASNWDLSLGYGGIFNFAHLAFFGVGVYFCAIVSKVLGVSPWLAIPAAGLAAAAAALVCLPVLRLKGIYVILVTFAFGQLVLHLVISQAEITGGSVGMVFLPALEIGDYKFTRDGKLGYYYIALTVFLLSTFFLRRLVKSSFGLAVVALRDNEEYAVSRGIFLARQRVYTLTASALFTGIAGGFYATYLRVASPEIFGFGVLSLVLSMLLVGGIGTIWGPVLAAFALTFLSEAMIDFGAWRHLIVAAMIVLVLLFYPGGLLMALDGIARRVTSAFSPKVD